MSHEHELTLLVYIDLADVLLLLSLRKDLMPNETTYALWEIVETILVCIDLTNVL